MKAGWSGAAEQRTERSERVLEAIDAVVDGVETLASGAGPEEIAARLADLPDRHLCDRVTQEIRARLLADWRSERRALSRREVSGILEVIYALERVRDALWPDGDEELSARLAAPDTFELLVEVAHDMRSPLSSILFLSETLRAARSGEVNELQRRQLGLIYGAALGLVSITQDVVDAARHGGRPTDDEPIPFSLGEIFDSIHELVRPVAEEKELDLTFRAPDRDFVMGHQLALTRALLNLTTNALKFTEEGAVAVEAERIDPDTVEFSVTDTGRGMTEEQLKTLFRPFRPSRYRRGHFFSNSGLGLSIARRLLEAVGSELHVESEVGIGTRFHFRVTLPPVSAH